MAEMKEIAICDGCDWNDASMDLLRVPVDINLEEKGKEYDTWLREVHRANPWHGLLNPSGVHYMSFVEWLKANLPTETSQVEQYWV